MVGIPSAKTDSAVALAQLVQCARRDFTSASHALGAVAIALAGQHRDELHAGNLRLFDAGSPAASPSAARAISEALDDLAVDANDAPHLVGRLHELLLGDVDRKVAGAHLTPARIAAGVVATLDDRWCGSPDAILDPAVGGGAFLLAAADRLVAKDIEPASALDRMRGVDINPDAVAVAEVALALWGLTHGVAPTLLPGLRVGDGLLDDLPKSAVVIGNPPFLSQLRSASSNIGDRRERLRERWGQLVDAYTDEAWLFLAAGANALTNGGQLAMIQPLSVLAARHGAAIREHVDQRCDLAAVWLSNGRVFDAAVEVCSVTLSHRPTTDASLKGPQSALPMQRRSGVGFDPVEPLATRPRPQDWGRSAAAIAGVPQVRLSGERNLADIASATAGFRDQFYGFAPHVREASGHGTANRLITVGMIDPLRLRWGTASFRFAQQRWQRPVIDRDGLEAADPALHQWVEQRMVPKVLVATQTRVIEAWVDELGDAVPATPVISLEPADPDLCWHLAALLSSPPLSAHAAAEAFGTAMAVRALKLTATALLSLPLPADQRAWDHGATLARAASQIGSVEGRRSALVELGATMAAAYKIDDPDLERWWRDLVPSR